MEGSLPVYEYRCSDCGADEEQLLPLGAPAPAACAACGGPLRRRFSRVAVRYQGWGFNSTDKLVPGDRPKKDFKELRERAERIADGG
jgi:putative FmdB family regulatory protein